MVPNTVCPWFCFLVLVHNTERNFMLLWHLGFEPMTMPCSFHLSKDPVKTAILWYSCVVFYWPCAYQNWVMWLIFEANFSRFLFRYSMAAIVLPLKKTKHNALIPKNCLIFDRIFTLMKWARHDHGFKSQVSKSINLLSVLWTSTKKQNQGNTVLGTIELCVRW